jgi:hypothetical protein
MHPFISFCWRETQPKSPGSNPERLMPDGVLFRFMFCTWSKQVKSGHQCVTADLETPQDSGISGKTHQQNTGESQFWTVRGRIKRVQGPYYIAL